MLSLLPVMLLNFCGLGSFNFIFLSPNALKAYYALRDVDSELDLYWWFGDSSFGWLCPLRLTAINVKALSAGLSATPPPPSNLC